MNSTLHIILKATTWQVSGLVMMMTLGFIFTGSFMTGGKIAIVSMALSFVTFIIHERLWGMVDKRVNDKSTRRLE